MVVDVQPVPHVEPIAVQRHRQPVKQVGDEQRDNLFRILVGPVVVRAAGDPHVHAVSASIGPGEQIATGLGRRIGRIRLQRVILGPRARFDGPVDLVSGNVHKPRHTGLQRGLQQVLGTYHIGHHERVGTHDRAVHM